MAKVLLIELACLDCVFKVGSFVKIFLKATTTTEWIGKKYLKFRAIVVDK